MPEKIKVYLNAQPHKLFKMKMGKGGNTEK